jgi:cardiolipin synthase A/B
VCGNGSDIDRSGHARRYDRANQGKVADALHGILLDRANAGVSVFVLYDAFGTANLARERVDSLRRAGVKVEPFRPLRISTLHLAQHRSHARGIVIDGRVGWTGGCGIDDQWLGDGRRNGSWRETNVPFEGPAVQQLQAAFAAAWTEPTGVLFTGRATAGGFADGVTAAGLLYATPTLRKHRSGALPRRVHLRFSIISVHHERILRAR